MGMWIECNGNPPHSFWDFPVWIKSLYDKHVLKIKLLAWLTKRLVNWEFFLFASKSFPTKIHILDKHTFGFSLCLIITLCGVQFPIVTKINYFCSTRPTSCCQCLWYKLASQERSGKWPQPASEFPLAAQLPLSMSPAETSCENSLGAVNPQVSIIQFLIAHLLCSRLSLHLPAHRRVLRRCFLAWGQLPCLLREERKKEERRERLGRKVAAVLPDFCTCPT